MSHKDWNESLELIEIPLLISVLDLMSGSNVLSSFTTRPYFKHDAELSSHKFLRMDLEERYKIVG